MTTLVTLDNVSLMLDQQPILQHINLELKAGEIVTVIGPNGAGKSSLLKVILGLQTPSSGSLKRKNKLTIGYMPQKLHITPQMPLSSERFLTLCGKRKDVLHWTQRLGVTHLLKTPIQKLSGGELQRMLLARALIRKPELLVLDEPAQGVDIAGQAALYHLIEELRTELGCAVLMVSHDLHVVMAKTDQVLCLNKHICCHGAPESVSQHPEYLQLFGKEGAEDIAIYTHDHDHQHDLHGDVVEDHSHNCHQANH